MTEKNAEPTPEVLKNAPERVPDDELKELNVELGKLLEAWKREYKMTTAKGATQMQKRYVARGPVNAFLDKHFNKSGLKLLVSVSDDFLKELLDYEEKTNEKADDGMEVLRYEFPDKEDREAPETGNNKLFVIVKGEIDLRLLPNELLSMKFVNGVIEY